MMSGWIDGRMDGWMDRQVDGWMEGTAFALLGDWVICAGRIHFVAFSL